MYKPINLIILSFILISYMERKTPYNPKQIN